MKRWAVWTNILPPTTASVGLVDLAILEEIKPPKSVHKAAGDSRKHGEPCVNHDQCIDFRMICSETEFVCQCDQFHDWTELNAYTSECVPNPQRLRSFLSENHETKGVEEKLSEEAHNLFVYLGLSGIIVISCGILLAFACIIFVIS
ncbi:hypothetical protein J6590_040288 [Homalodisca vitripennis]|nr:hypothetical protein J6590_040288 [Homalodisca vitripennis]